MISHLLNVVFPCICMSCKENYTSSQEGICISCLISLPKTHHWKHRENPMFQNLSAHAPVDFALAYFYYSRKSKTANILHAIKYKNKPDMARMLGKLFGQTVVSYLDIQPEDVLVPIPLHPSKLLLRGYNQSACLAEGISEATGIPVFENVLIRKHNNASQTRKSRENRWKDSDAIFEAISTSLPSQRVILVDDVYTTGATLVAASKALKKKMSYTRIGVLTLARSRD
jgi:ComF family protein